MIRQISSGQGQNPPGRLLRRSPSPAARRRRNAFGLKTPFWYRPHDQRRLKRLRYPRANTTKSNKAPKPPGFTTSDGDQLAVISAIAFLSSQVGVSGLSNLARRFSDFSFLTGHFEELEGTVMVLYIGGKTWILARRPALLETTMIFPISRGVLDDTLLTYQHQEGHFSGGDAGDIVHSGNTLSLHFRDQREYTAFKSSITNNHKSCMAEAAEVEQQVNSSLWHHAKKVFMDASLAKLRSRRASSSQFLPL